MRWTQMQLTSCSCYTIKQIVGYSLALLAHAARGAQAVDHHLNESPGLRRLATRSGMGHWQNAVHTSITCQACVSLASHTQDGIAICMCAHQGRTHDPSGHCQVEGGRTHPAAAVHGPARRVPRRSRASTQRAPLSVCSDLTT